MRMKWMIAYILLFFSSYDENIFSQDEVNQYEIALKRAKYILNGLFPDENEFSTSQDLSSYRQTVRTFLESDQFYPMLMRYHEKLLGVGLPLEYIDELLRDDIDFKENKFAQIFCETDSKERLNCRWASESSSSSANSCTTAEEEPVSIFWYPGLIAWVCPSIVRSCGNDLSKCFIEYKDEKLAANSELGTTQAFDSRYSVIKSLSKQSAGIATAVTIENFPYTSILQPGITAVDGAISHFYQQSHHFKLEQLQLSQDLLDAVKQIPLTDTRFHLININSGSVYEQGGILTTFGWLRRYEKNRTRANQLYERLLCRKFTAELPRIFPQDPGNLRETPGCEGCHATLDPLADFFKVWGEGGELYQGHKDVVETYFGGKTGLYVEDLANIIRSDNAFATCTVEHAWDWLMGRGFYADEDKIRTALTDYFITTDYSFKELLYAIATHPNFLMTQRIGGLVDDPLSEPPLGEPPGGNDLPECEGEYTFENNIQNKVSLCKGCHNQTNPARQGLSPLESKEDWQQSAQQALAIMTSGQMPPGQGGPPRIGEVFEFKEAVRCWIEGGKN